MQKPSCKHENFLETISPTADCRICGPLAKCSQCGEILAIKNRQEVGVSHVRNADGTISHVEPEAR